MLVLRSTSELTTIKCCAACALRIYKQQTDEQESDPYQSIEIN